MERSDIRESHTTPAPDFAEFILGRTEGATRGLDPGYKHALHTAQYGWRSFLSIHAL